MGPLEATANAIDAANLPVNLVIVTGRNQRLQEKLENRAWKHSHKIYGFVKNMPDLMAAADVLITKAAGNHQRRFHFRTPNHPLQPPAGQEEGNVLYVIGEGAGMWAPEPAMVVSVIKNWLKHPDRLAETTAASRSVARPLAARQIARHLMEQAQKRGDK
jgi:UDP-N-acetylglucosamine:LPS N-acetylglucosamine transferase